MLAIILGLVSGSLWESWRASSACGPFSYRDETSGVFPGVSFACRRARLVSVFTTCRLFIAGEANSQPGGFRSAKIAIFTASLSPGVIGTAILGGPKHKPTNDGRHS
jgi:hypothetical protein